MCVLCVWIDVHCGDVAANTNYFTGKIKVHIFKRESLNLKQRPVWEYHLLCYAYRYVIGKIFTYM